MIYKTASTWPENSDSEASIHDDILGSEASLHGQETLLTRDAARQLLDQIARNEKPTESITTKLNLRAAEAREDDAMTRAVVSYMLPGSIFVLAPDKMYNGSRIQGDYFQRTEAIPDP